MTYIIDATFILTLILKEVANYMLKPFAISAAGVADELAAGFLRAWFLRFNFFQPNHHFVDRIAIPLGQYEFLADEVILRRRRPHAEDNLAARVQLAIQDFKHFRPNLRDQSDT